VLSDKKNTAYNARMLLHVNRSEPGQPFGGIHWHVKRDGPRRILRRPTIKRQDIPWMRVTNLKDGTSRVFRTAEFKGEPPANLIRVMDCMDCHNRPAHVFPTANDTVEKAIATGALSTKLPAVKRVAVQAMTQKEITTGADAAQQIADFMRAKYTDPALAGELPGAITTVQRIFGDHVPGAQGRLARLPEQHRPQGLAGLLPLPRRQAQDGVGPDGAGERLQFLPHDHRPGPAARSWNPSRRRD
jgi:hypothetical protein